MAKPRRYGDDVRTLKVQEDQAAAGGRGLTLSIVGADVLTSHPLPASGEVTIGRGQQAQIRIDDISISRAHAILRVGAQLSVEDVGSINGTRVGGRALVRGERRTIAIGETVEVGSVTIVVLGASRGPTAQPRRLWTHDYFESRLEEECARAGRTPAPFAVARLSVSGEASDGAVQETLAQVLGAAHGVAYYGPGEYEALLLGLGPDEAGQLIDRLAARLGELDVQLKRGLACFPGDGRTPEALVAQACRALRGAGDGSTAVVIVDPAMQRLHQLAERVAAGAISVLLLGETGAGKEILAETIHRHSPRAKKPLLRLNCSALAENLLESELFGHEKGSFSGAVQAKVGLLESAEGGTVFLDELGEMPLSLQAKLLRVIEERKVMRVGGLKAKPIDVRFISATNRNLEEEIARGTFRQDLFYRLNGISLVIPPLRERPSEIAELAEVFLERAAHDLGRPTAPTLSPDVLAMLQRYLWPGNIRELRNVMERAVLLCSGPTIALEHLPLDKMRSTFADGTTRAVAAAPAPPAPPRTTGVGELLAAEPTLPYAVMPRLSAVELAERERVIAALDRCAGNQTQAAKMLGISRGTLIVRLTRFNLPRPRRRDE